MALLFADGFEDGTLAWAFTGTMASVAGGRFGNGIGVTASSSSSASTGFPPTTGVILAGVAHRPQGVGGIMAFNDSAIMNIGLVRGGGGEVVCYRQSMATVLGSSASGVLPINAWSYVELKVTASQTVGIIQVRVNGVLVINLTNQDTLSASATRNNELRLGNNAASSNQNGDLFDDVYIADDTGSYNTDFLGDLTVEHLRPGADDTVQFLGSDGNSVDNFALVDEAGAFVGADYVASSTVGQRDLYVPVASARAASSGVFGVLVSAVAQKTDSGARTVRMCCKEGAGGSIRQSAELGLPTSFGEVNAVFERKGDGTMFTVADVNALRMGMDVMT